MIRTVLLLFIAFLTFASCNSLKDGLGRKSPHERYARMLQESKLENTALGSEWIAAASRALVSPVSIQLPYREKGYVEADDPTSSGFVFSLKRGEVVVVELTMIPENSLNVFLDLWRSAGAGEPDLLESADTSSSALRHEVKEDGNYILRIQPELLRAFEYTLTIRTEPSLAFPVDLRHNPRVQSYWGADRDGGARRHEGIDIFASKGTPAIAIAEGRVSRVNENVLGGKVVFMRPGGSNVSIYYAHLDSQLVREGQRVEIGDTIGLIGNTGNARTTPPHLHLGIYAAGGAIDPFPFVNYNRPLPGNFSVEKDILNSMVRNTSAANFEYVSTTALHRVPIQPNSAMKVIAATEKTYRVELPGGSTGLINKNHISKGTIRKLTLRDSTRLLDQPHPNAAAKLEIQPGTTVDLIGHHGNFHYVKTDKAEGWITMPRQTPH